ESLSDDMNKNELLSFAASLEQQSEHPIAQGIVKAAKEAGLALKKVENFESLTAKGIQGKIEGQNWKVVSPGYLKDNDINILDQAGSDEAETIVYVLQENLIIGFIALSDQIREESPKAI